VLRRGLEDWLREVSDAAERFTGARVLWRFSKGGQPNVRSSLQMVDNGFERMNH